MVTRAFYCCVYAMSPSYIICMSSLISSLSSLLFIKKNMMLEFCKVVWFICLVTFPLFAFAALLLLFLLLYDAWILQSCVIFCLVPFPLFPLLLFYHYFIIIWCMNFAKMSDLLVSFPGFSDIKKIRFAKIEVVKW